ncbi:organic solute transporter Ostalpha-domain-containing protein [Gilbertella persicaria]|uniref:organic solute transporter Ostalpha-domain-containing protein n=1 Tax=Gilbertella persicaria TaxID=101096 RepID=UPI002220D390|nr:organic solute transporter Ostalpha-domain-containing protein [Gilbertella persicaria]KAI8077998.1 organic solute transporter Ostalpha-domain-containing protein [Gilbertella persicaria]
MHVWGWLASGFLVLVTVTIASHTINEHLHHYYTPETQRHKVRVIAYPAAYSILAWLSYLKYDYETVILFFARLFESFAVYNLYMCLQSYLQPYRDRNEGVKESISTKVFGLFTFKLKSKWGLHFRVIIDILVFQFPIWNIISALVSIFAQIKGVYCDGVFSVHGAYTYLTVIQFISLSIILMALFTYLSVFENEWKEGDIQAHKMFWCVKGPIMVIFYFGDILLAILTYFNVIKDIPYSTTSGTYWTVAAIKNGYYVLIICTTMAVVSMLMQVYFGLRLKEYENEEPNYSYLEAVWDGYLAYIPQFLKNVFMCGGDTVVLAKKRIKLKKERRLSEDERNLLTPSEINAATEMNQASIHEYLAQPIPSFQNKLYDEDTRYQRHQQHNFNALPLEPLSIKSSTSVYSTEQDKASEVEDLVVQQEPTAVPIPPPPPPMQSRIVNHNDELKLIHQDSQHFQPHDK